MTKEEVVTSNSPVVVGIDGSPDALRATRWAATYAHAVGSPLRFVHALVVPDWISAYVSSPLSRTDPLDNELRVRGAHLVEAAAAVAVAAAPGVTIDTAVEQGGVLDVVQAESHQARLIVLGSHPLGSGHEVAEGSNIIGVVNAARCPVVLCRGTGDDKSVRRGSVVVGVDGSDHSETAVRIAMEYAQVARVAVVVVQAFQVSTLRMVEFNAGFSDWDEFIDSHRRRLERHFDAVGARFPDVALTVTCLDGEPADTLMSVSGPDDLIVVGARGLGRVAGTILGSVSQDLIHHSKSSLMIVH